SPDATQPPRNAPSSPAREGSEGASSLAQRLQAMLGGVDAPAHGVTAGEQGPWLPGAVDDGETFDATRLLAIMRSDGAQAANTTAGATVVTVLGQERHLALAGMPPELASVLQQEQDLA